MERTNNLNRIRSTAETKYSVTSSPLSTFTLHWWKHIGLIGYGWKHETKRQLTFLSFFLEKQKKSTIIKHPFSFFFPFVIWKKNTCDKINFVIVCFLCLPEAVDDAGERGSTPCTTFFSSYFELPFSLLALGSWRKIKRNSGSLRCKAASQKRLLIWHKSNRKKSGRKKGTKNGRVRSGRKWWTLVTHSTKKKNIAIIITFHK